MNKAVDQYRKDLKRFLLCSSKVKERLLNQYEYTLLFFLADNPSPTMDELNQAFGTPVVMAQTLMAEVTPEEYKKYRVIMVIKRIFIGILLGIFLIFTAYVYFVKETPINVTEQIIPEATNLPVSNIDSN